MVSKYDRSLTRDIAVVGNVWWVQILGVSSLILKELSSTLLWRHSVSLSSRGLPLLLHDWEGSVWMQRKLERKQSTREEKTAAFPVLSLSNFSSTCWWVN